MRKNHNQIAKCLYRKTRIKEKIVRTYLEESKITQKPQPGLEDKLKNPERDRNMNRSEASGILSDRLKIERENMGKMKKQQTRD